MTRPVGRPTVIASGPLAPLLAHVGGSVLALAESTGLERSTLYRIGAGRTKPSPAVRALLNTWAQRRGLALPFPVTKAA